MLQLHLLYSRNGPCFNTPSVWVRRSAVRWPFDPLNARSPHPCRPHGVTHALLLPVRYSAEPAGADEVTSGPAERSGEGGGVAETRVTVRASRGRWGSRTGARPRCSAGMAFASPAQPMPLCCDAPSGPTGRARVGSRGEAMSAARAFRVKEIKNCLSGIAPGSLGGPQVAPRSPRVCTCFRLFRTLVIQYRA